MKKFSLVVIVIMLPVLLLHGREKPTAFPVLKGPYLGQKAPGMEPRVFAPGIISTELNTRDMAVTPDGKEIYFCVNLANYTFSTILVTRQKDGSWTEPEVMEHMDNPAWWNIEPCISADGKKFFFMSNRPDKSKGETKGDEDIWVMDRAADGWGEPYNPGLPVNSDSPEFFPSLTRDNTLYMGPAVNTPSGSEYSANVSPDGKYLFFMTSRTLPREQWPEKLSANFLHGLHGRQGNGNSSIYWVDAGVIENLRPKKIQ